MDVAVPFFGGLLGGAVIVVAFDAWLSPPLLLGLGLAAIAGSLRVLM